MHEKRDYPITDLQGRANCVIVLFVANLSEKGNFAMPMECYLCVLNAPLVGKKRVENWAKFQGQRKSNVKYFF